jgi:hypothetical protein
MYCKKRRWAAEFQGEQHFIYVKCWPNGVNYDALKIEQCRAHGVKLIIVLKTEFDAVEKQGGIPALLVWAANLLRDAGIPMLANPGEFVLDVNFSKIDAWTEDCHSFAATHEGAAFLGDICHGPNIKYPYFCKSHGEFKRSLKELRAGAWCRPCGLKRRADSRRIDFVNRSRFRYECRRLEIRNEPHYHEVHRSGAFGEIQMPGNPRRVYNCTSLELFQKDDKDSPPWRYTDKHDELAHLVNHPGEITAAAAAREKPMLPKQPTKAAENDNCDALLDRLHCIYRGGGIPD